MINNRKLLQVCALAAAFWLSAEVCGVYGQRRSRHSRHRAAQSKVAEDGPPLAEGEVRLRLIDGTRIPVDDAWESPQGIWYRKSGITHLVARDHVKAIERGTAAKPPDESQETTVTVAEPPQSNDSDRPAWIFLHGGAKVEADSATESAAGVWYRRGPLSIFIERSRIDHIEREDPESLAKGGLKKERGWSTGSRRLDALIRQSGAKYKVDPYLIFCVMEQESHFNSRALSPRGAQGLMQLMPGTSARFGVRRPHDPAQNVTGGTRYLRQLLDRFNGRVDLVLASYNAGEGAVIRFGHRVPPYRETRAYVKRVTYRYRGPKPPARKATGNATSAGGT